eukprot:5169815-Ditylum_brightwellii.AAC.1
MLYNKANSVVHDMAKVLKVNFTKDYGALLASLEAEETVHFLDKKLFVFVYFCALESLEKAKKYAHSRPHRVLMLVAEMDVLTEKVDPLVDNDL